MTDSRTLWPAYLVERARRAPPLDCGVVANSTPVVLFGNPRARIATIGINPSDNEFLKQRRGQEPRVLLSGDKRRLATLPSLGVQRYRDIDERLGSEIVCECATYFERQPYKRWFRPLNCILRDGLGVSYCDGTACHLDLAQWATSPSWDELEGSIRKRLLEDGLPFLLELLRREHYRLVIVNGRSVINAIKCAGIITWTPVGYPEGPPSTDFYEGEFGDTRFLAWSCYVQRNPQYIPALAGFVARESNEDPQCEAPSTPPAPPQPPEVGENVMPDSCTLWPAYLVEQARRRPPAGCLNEIVKDSTPVVAFGNPVRAAVATLGLNPSWMEFRDEKNRELLLGDQRRLATFESLETSSYGEIDDRRGAKIIDECAGYFDRRPYEWFLPLDHILRAGVRASYYPGAAYLETACHLDLFPWATSSIWRKLKNPVRDLFLKDGLPLLCELLRRERYRLVIANGRSVIDEIERAGFTTWNEVEPIKGNPPVKLYVGEGGATRFLAWSCNIQKHIKEQPEHIPALIRFVAIYGGTGGTS